MLGRAGGEGLVCVRVRACKCARRSQAGSQESTQHASLGPSFRGAQEGDSRGRVAACARS